MIQPRAGQWYRHADHAQQFRVLGVDEEEGLVEVQFADGDLTDMDLADWQDLVTETLPPEVQRPPA